MTVEDHENVIVSPAKCVKSTELTAVLIIQEDFAYIAGIYKAKKLGKDRTMVEYSTGIRHKKHFP